MYFTVQQKAVEDYEHICDTTPFGSNISIKYLHLFINNCPKLDRLSVTVITEEATD